MSRMIQRHREDWPQLIALAVIVVTVCLAQTGTAGPGLERLIGFGMMSNRVILLTFGG